MKILQIATDLDFDEALKSLIKDNVKIKMSSVTTNVYFIDFIIDFLLETDYDIELKILNDLKEQKIQYIEL
jgi:hypothetical protein